MYDLDIFRPIRQLNRLDKVLDREWSSRGLLNNFFKEFDVLFGDAKYMDGNTLVYEIEVPGFNKDNIKMEVNNGILTVKGERDVGESHAGKKYIEKTLDIGDINSDNLSAEVNDGILYVKIGLPESEQQTEPKKIEVK